VTTTGPPADAPLVLVVDTEPEQGFTRIQLERRYGQDYRIEAAGSATDASDQLVERAGVEATVAMVVVDHAIAGADDVLRRVRSLFPRAKRGLIFEQASDTATEAIPRALALGLIDFFVIKPMRSPDEQFHSTITEFLYEWSRSETSDVVAVEVIGERSSSKSFEIRDLLERNSVPFVFHATDGPEAGVLLRELGLTADDTPVFVFFEGTVLVDPDYHEIVEVLGSSFAIDDRCHDVAIIGGGPAGLAAAVYAASEGLSTLIVEREAIGGQAGSSSLIRNYLGFPHGVAGRELAGRAARQAWAFGAKFHWMDSAVSLDRDGDECVVVLSNGSKVRSRSAVIACGMRWRRLDVPHLEDLIGAGVYYGAAVSEARAMQGGSVYVVGGGNSAGQAALNLARYAKRVCLLVRSDSLADSMSDYLVNELAGTSNIEVRFNRVVVGCEGVDRLERLVTRDRAGDHDTTEPADGLFVLIGGEPRTDWLPPSVARDRWGFVTTGQDVADGASSDRAPLPFETSLPGVFAVGDARHGSMKRVASAVGEGASVIHSCHRYLEVAAGATE